MIKIKEFFKYENANAIEVTFINEDIVIHCQAYSELQMDLLKEDCLKYGVKLNKEQLALIKEVEDNIILPTKEGLEAIALENEKQRVLLIKQEAGRIIEAKYPMYKQNNILMSGINVDIKAMNDYISNIRKISNEAEINKTLFDDVVWK